MNIAVTGAGKMGLPLRAPAKRPDPIERAIPGRNEDCVRPENACTLHCSPSEIGP